MVRVLSIGQATVCETEGSTDNKGYSRRGGKAVLDKVTRAKIIYKKIQQMSVFQYCELKTAPMKMWKTSANCCPSQGKAPRPVGGGDSDATAGSSHLKEEHLLEFCALNSFAS